MAPSVGELLLKAIDEVSLVVGTCQSITDGRVVESLVDLLELRVLVAEFEQGRPDLDAVAIGERRRVVPDVFTVDGCAIRAVQIGEVDALQCSSWQLRCPITPWRIVTLLGRPNAVSGALET